MTSNSKTRVLWVIKGLGPGGAERLLCAAGRSHDAERFHIECAYVLPWKDHLAEELERAGVRTHCLSQARKDRLWPVRLARLVRRGGWDVVHVHSPLPGSVARVVARTMAKSDRPILVCTEHNRWATHRLPTRIANRMTSRWDDTSFAVTDEVKGSMSGPVAARVETLRHGIEVEATARATADRAVVRAELGIASDEFVVGTVANFRPQKDYPNLLQAARLLADRGVAVRFVAVGQGPEEVQTRRLRDELRLQNLVILTGFRDDAVRVMGACDLFTLASKWEGLPVALMEALALGLPVVATAVGGIAEELTDGVNALLVPASDAEALATAIERLISDEQLRALLGAASIHLAPAFDVCSAVERIEEIYAAVAPHHRPPALTSPSPRPRPAGLEIRPSTPDDRPEILELCRTSLGWGDDTRFEQLFSWKHDHNAFGPSYIWVATDADRVVGLRAFMRWEFVRGTEVLRAVRAVDTATHPEYQGRGLFTAMTLHALDEVKADGVDFVFNTPNDKSRPGYLKMGWQALGCVPASVKVTGPIGAWRMARSRVAASHWPEALNVGTSINDVIEEVDFAASCRSFDPRRMTTRTSIEFLTWRYGASFLGYRVIADGEGAVVVRMRSRGAASELVLLGKFGTNEITYAHTVARIAKSVDADYVVRVGGADFRHGFVPIPGGGPMLMWRSLNMASAPSLPNWCLTMGDVELF